MQPTSPALEPSPEKGHTTFVEAALQHGPREAIDLHDEQSPPSGGGCRAQSHTSNHSVEPALEK
jgi:hypothetical protein